MEKIKYYLRAIFSPERYVVWMSRHGWLNWLPDKAFVKLFYRFKFRHKLHLNPPVTFSEKMQWLKLYDHNPLYNLLVDKAAVKDYAAGKIGAEYIVPTLGIWESVDDIDFLSLPEKFVIKCTHDSHDLIICRDKSKLNWQAIKQALAKGLKRDYYKLYREWAYKDVPRRIIAEQLIEGRNSRDLYDYKFYCFNGKVEFVKIDCDRFTHHTEIHLDADGNPLPFKFTSTDTPAVLPEIPPEMKKMEQLAEALAQDLPFVRVDFYDVDGRIYFGEITMYPFAGFDVFSDEAWDYIWGKKLSLPFESASN